jgi:penicillin amidase
MRQGRFFSPAVVVAIGVTAVLAALLGRTEHAGATGRPAPVTRTEDTPAPPGSVQRDAFGVPHVHAPDDRAAMYWLGVADATDRFFQMDLLRRTFSGTSAELIGRGFLRSDGLFRSFGLRRAAEASLPLYAEASRELLEAYAVGVNAWLTTPGRVLPAEYAALRLTRASIPLWSPVDSLVVSKGYGYLLSFQSDLTTTAQLEAYQKAGAKAGFDGTRLFQQDVNRFAPFVPVPSAPIRASGRKALADSSASPLPAVENLAREYEARADGASWVEALATSSLARGSNAWAISGRLTESGRPMLASDPHLQLEVPAVFHEVHLHVGPAGPRQTHLAGVAFPGVPAIVQGCNPRMCWASTSSGFDVTDWFREELVLNAETHLPEATVFDGHREPLTILPQQFRVNQLDDAVDHVVETPLAPAAGGVTYVVQRRNGPVITVDLTGSVPTGVSVQFVGFMPTRDLETFFAWMHASTVDEFDAGLRFASIPQHWVYADVDGHIEYADSGFVPLREDLETLGRADGEPPYYVRDGTHRHHNEWLADPASPMHFRVLPFDELPHVRDPKQGYVLSANNDPVGLTFDNDPLQARRAAGGVYYLGAAFDCGLRASRIQQLIGEHVSSRRKVSLADMRTMQGDTVLPDAAVLLPYLLQAFEHASAPSADSKLAALARDPAVVEAIERLRRWDFTTPTGVRQPLPGLEAGTTDVSVEEARSSVAATIYAVWRGEVLRRVIDDTLGRLGLTAFVPSDQAAVTALRNLLDGFGRHRGVGGSGLNFFATNDTSTPEVARDEILLGSLQTGLQSLAGPDYAVAFGQSNRQDDYRWGKLHRVVLAHVLAKDFNVPPASGLTSFRDNLAGFTRPGGFETIDAGPHRLRAKGTDGFMFRVGAARRFIAALGPRAISAEEIIPGGASDDQHSPFHVDGLLLWLENRYRELLPGPSDPLHDDLPGLTHLPTNTEWTAARPR